MPKLSLDEITINWQKKSCCQLCDWSQAHGTVCSISAIGLVTRSSIKILISEEHPYLFFFCNAILLFSIVLCSLTYLIQVLLYFSAQKMICCVSWCGILFHVCYHYILIVSWCLFLLHTFPAFNVEKWFPYIFKLNWGRRKGNKTTLF